MVQQIVFALLLLAVSIYAFRAYSNIRSNILLGGPYETNASTNERWRNVLLVAFGQKKMFKRFIPAILHLFIYVAFLFTQIELIEILIDGLGGVHRFFAPKLGIVYTILINFIEILSILAFVATVVFLWRRNVLKTPRFHMREMKGWPFKDANLILLGEVLLIIGIFSMNGADTQLQELDPEHYPNTGHLALSSIVGSTLFSGLSAGTLHIIERFGWWLHIMVVLGFIAYLPKSKHLHIFFAFINTYFAPNRSRGHMLNMPAIHNEVKSMMGLAPESEAMSMDDDIPEFGVKDVFGLSWKNILDAYTCTECGRCTSVCPANITGKKLSPRKIVMAVRDRAEEVGEKIRSGNAEFIAEGKRSDDAKLSAENFDDGKSLFDYIEREELHACTTCNACVEACPVLINPLEPILQMRRYEVLTESAGPADWMPMFTSMENSGAPWQLPDERDAWTKEMS